MNSPFLFPELEITKENLTTVLQEACTKWNSEHPNSKKPETLRDFLLNIHLRWLAITYSDWKTSDLIEALVDERRHGGRGLVEYTNEELLDLLFEDSVVSVYVKDGRSLSDLLAEHPWIVYAEDEVSGD